MFRKILINLFFVSIALSETLHSGHSPFANKRQYEEFLKTRYYSQQGNGQTHGSKPGYKKHHAAPLEEAALPIQKKINTNGSLWHAAGKTACLIDKIAGYGSVNSFLNNMFFKIYDATQGFIPEIRSMEMLVPNFGNYIASAATDATIDQIKKRLPYGANLFTKFCDTKTHTCLFERFVEQSNAENKESLIVTARKGKNALECIRLFALVYKLTEHFKLMQKHGANATIPYCSFLAQGLERAIQAHKNLMEKTTKKSSLDNMLESTTQLLTNLIEVSKKRIPYLPLQGIHLADLAVNAGINSLARAQKAYEAENFKSSNTEYDDDAD